MEALGFTIREEAVLRTLTDDVLKSSEIEGEKLDADQVRSSVARRLGMDIGGLKPADRHVEGVVEMMLDATQRYDQPLTQERLFAWHASLFPTGRAACTASPSARGATTARRRCRWCPDRSGASACTSRRRRPRGWTTRCAGSSSGSTATRRSEPVLKAALAHLWFVTIHPFDDGNGRIARAIADMALARSEESPQRFYSMSAQIREERGDYYRILEQTQRGTLDITPWMEWFLACLTRAIEGAQTTLAGVIAKARYWEKLRDVPLNDRQRLVINRLLDGFEGKLTTSKWAALTKCSPDTALRDIQQLVERGVLVRNAAGGAPATRSRPSRPVPRDGQRIRQLSGGRRGQSPHWSPRRNRGTLYPSRCTPDGPSGVATAADLAPPSTTARHRARLEAPPTSTPSTSPAAASCRNNSRAAPQPQGLAPAALFQRGHVRHGLADERHSVPGALRQRARVDVHGEQRGRRRRPSRHNTSYECRPITMALKLA